MPEQQPSDDELVAQAQQGSLQAFTTLYERHLPTVMNRVRYVVPTADVEDVVQEIFIGAMRTLPSFKGDALFTTWLRTLTNRRVADYYRSRQHSQARQTVALGETLVRTLHAPAESNPANLDNNLMLTQAMQTLPESYREIILLRFAEGLQFNEIAEQQGRSLEATKSLFRRAIAALRKEVGAHDG